MRLLVCFAAATACVAQTTPPPAAVTPPEPSILVGLGVLQNSPRPVPFGVIGLRVKGESWQWNTAEFESVGTHPFQLNFKFQAGLAHKVATLNGIDVYAVAGLGPSVTGGTSGTSLAGGFLAMAHMHAGFSGSVYARVCQNTVPDPASPGQTKTQTSAMLGILVSKAN
jgi:hypothetical protein